MKKLSISDVDGGFFRSKRVFLRVDYNVPLKDGKVEDDYRIRKSLDTVNYLVRNGAKLIIASHLGRPKGKDPKYSLEPVARRLSELVGKNVVFSHEVVGEAAERRSKELGDGEIMLLENLRFHEGESKDDESFARELRKLSDIYVNDAFGTAHRKNASVHALAKLHEHRFAGLLMERELEYLSMLLETPKRPFVSIVGGAKVSDKIGVLENLASRSDGLIVGGAMAYTFLKAKGIDVGDSLVDESSLEFARSFLERYGDRVVLPSDHVCYDGKEVRTFRSSIPEGWKGYDVGEESIAHFKKYLRDASMIFWNGPLGMFEDERFARGTFAIASFLADMEAIVILGGGDTVSAIHKAGIDESKFTHVSTGGGATLEFLSGRKLPALEVLPDKE